MINYGSHVPKVEARLEPYNPPVNETRLKPFFILYSGINDTLITTPELEKIMLPMWFYEGSSRRKNDYTREEVRNFCVEIKSDMTRGYTCQ